MGLGPTGSVRETEAEKVVGGATGKGGCPWPEHGWPTAGAAGKEDSGGRAGMGAGFFLSRVQWRGGCLGIVGPSWASGQTSNTDVPSLCRWRQRPVVYWFSHMLPRTCVALVLFLACLCPHFMASGGQRSHGRPLVSSPGILPHSHLPTPGAFCHSYPTDPLVPFLILNHSYPTGPQPPSSYSITATPLNPSPLPHTQYVSSVTSFSKPLLL